MKSFSLKPGAEFILDGEPWIVHSTHNKEHGARLFTRKRLDSEEYVTEPLEQVLELYHQGRIQGAAFGTEGSPISEGKVKDPEYSKEAKALLHMRKQYVMAILTDDRTLLPLKVREKNIKKAFLEGKRAREIAGIDIIESRAQKEQQGYERFIRYEKKPSERTVRNWYQDWARCGHQDYGLLPNGGDVQVRILRAAPELIDRIKELIDKKCKGREKWRISDLAAAIPDVSYATIRRTLYRYVNQFKLDTAKLGYFRAKNKTPSGLPRPMPDAILVEVESDHHELDVLIVDLDENIILGKAFITLIIDVKSGVIFGRYISFRKNKNAVLKAIRHAILPKPDRRWVFGMFLNFHCDNGDGYAKLAPDLKALSIEPLNVRKKQGNDKPRAERAGGTINDAVCHKLKGTTFSNFKNAEDYKSEKFAFITMDELIDLIDEYILTVHNEGRHKLTNKHRMVTWLSDPLSKYIRLPRSVQEIEILTLPMTERSIQRDGISLNNILYDYGDLAELRHRHGIQAKVQVRYDEDELQSIWVKHDSDEEWTRVRAHDETYHIKGYTLTLHNKLRELALKEGLPVEDLLRNKDKINRRIEQLNEDAGRRFKARTSGKSSESPAGKTAEETAIDEWDVDVFSEVGEE